MNSINWTDLRRTADDGGFQVLPHGEYDCYVNSANGGQTSTGKGRIRVTFKVESGPHANAVVTNDFVLTADNSNAMSIWFRNMTALGLTSEYFDANPSSSIDKVAGDLAARRSRCRLRLSTRTWQGQERNNVDAVMPPMPGTAASAPPGPSPHQAPAAHHTPADAAPAASTPLPIPSTPALPDDLPF